MKILVTGGSGFLGRNLVARLSHDHEVFLLARTAGGNARLWQVATGITVVDLKCVDLSALFLGHRFDAIIHCATSYFRDEKCFNAAIEANLTLPLKLLGFAIQNGVRCFINADTVLDKWVSRYALSKSHLRDWLKVFASEIKVINMQLEHFYGRDDDSTKFVAGIVKQLMFNVDNRIALTNGEQKRCFIHINDVVAAFEVVVRRLDDIPNGFNVFQVGSREQLSIRSFVELVRELCGNTRSTLDFGVLAYRPYESMEVCLDVSGLEALGWKEQTSLREGLLDVIAHQRAEAGVATGV